MPAQWNLLPFVVVVVAAYNGIVVVVAVVGVVVGQGRRRGVVAILD